MLLKIFYGYLIITIYLQSSVKTDQAKSDEEKLRQFLQLNELVETTGEKITINYWDDIIQQMSNLRNESIILPVSFGISMKFGYSKLAFYFRLQKLYKEKLHNKIIASQPNHSVTEIINISLSQLKLFDENIMKELSAGIEESLSDTGSVLQKISWHELAREDLIEVGNTQRLSIQKMLDESLLRIYSHLDVNQFLDKDQRLDTYSESNKILQVMVYGALRHAMSMKNNGKSPYLFKLAFLIRNHRKYVRHIIATEYFEQYLEQLTQSFNGCIRNIVKEETLKIKNVKYEEYLYVTAWDKNWRTTPAHFSPNTYYPLFSWIPRVLDETGRFFVEFENDRLWIRSGSDPRRYVDTSCGSPVHTPISDRTDWNAVVITPSDVDSENCYIQNFNTRKYMYSASNDYNEDTARRQTFSNGTNPSDSSYLWNFSAFSVIR